MSIVRKLPPICRCIHSGFLNGSPFRMTTFGLDFLGGLDLGDSFGNFWFFAVSVMLERYDASGRARSTTRKKRANANAESLHIVDTLLILAGLGWWFRYWPEEHLVGNFFDALQKQDYKTAYGIWMHDPDWTAASRQHPKYPFNEFYRDWGPGGEWGLIKTQKMYGASTCPGRRQRSGGGRDRERPRRTRAGVGGEIGQDVELIRRAS